MGKKMNEHVRIEGKVAIILTARELIINIGNNQGVREGMKFKIMAKEVLEIPDPDGGDILGSLDREKVRVMVTEVQDKFSICKTYMKRITPGYKFPDLSLLFTPSREVHETLKIEDASLPPPLSEDESYVKSGDRVIQLLDEVVE